LNLIKQYQSNRDWTCLWADIPAQRQVGWPAFYAHASHVAVAVSIEGLQKCIPT
jgi:hypothetical protein